VYVPRLPTRVTTVYITRFFDHTSVLPVKVHVMLTKFGCTITGQSYCEFGSVHQAHMALVKNQCYMGLILVHMSPVSRSNVIKTIARPLQQRNCRDNRGVGPWQLNTMTRPWQYHLGPQFSKFHQ
jgi:hypothetical protein